MQNVLLLLDLLVFRLESIRVLLHRLLYHQLSQVLQVLCVVAFSAVAVHSTHQSLCKALAVELQAPRLFAIAFHHFLLVELGHFFLENFFGRLRLWGIVLVLDFVEAVLLGVPERLEENQGVLSVFHLGVVEEIFDQIRFLNEETLGIHLFDVRGVEKEVWLQIHQRALEAVEEVLSPWVLHVLEQQVELVHTDVRLFWVVLDGQFGKRLEKLNVGENEGLLFRGHLLEQVEVFIREVQDEGVVAEPPVEAVLHVLYKNSH